LERWTDDLINIVSLGKWKELKEKYNYTDLYHLGLVFNIKLNDGSTKYIQAEKIEEVFITDEPSLLKGQNYQTQTAMVSMNINLEDLMNITLKRVGNELFFGYSGLGGTRKKNNCQDYVKMLLETLNLWENPLKDFVLQDVEELAKEIPKLSLQIMDKFTDLGNITSKWSGAGLENDDNYKLHAVIIKKNINHDEARKIAQDIIKDKNKQFMRETKLSYRFRNISKQKFKPKSFRTKKINKNVSLVFGELK
jgi:hypothetical protein